MVAEFGDIPLVGDQECVGFEVFDFDVIELGFLKVLKRKNDTFVFARPPGAYTFVKGQELAGFIASELAGMVKQSVFTEVVLTFASVSAS